MPVPERIPFAAILAGGRARRMGRDKAGIRLAGVPLIERVLDRVREVAEEVLVVGGPPRLNHRGVPTLPDLFPGANAMGGIATALVHAVRRKGPGTWVLCVPCDTPFLEPALLRELFKRRKGVDVVVPRTSRGWEPLCALYRSTCLDALRRAITAENFRVFAVYTAVRCRAVPEEDLRRVDPGLRSFININRPEDLTGAERQLQYPKPPASSPERDALCAANPKRLSSRR